MLALAYLSDLVECGERCPGNFRIQLLALGDLVLTVVLHGSSVLLGGTVSDRLAVAYSYPWLLTLRTCEGDVI